MLNIRIKNQKELKEYKCDDILQGKKYMSQNAVSFHYVKPEAMYAYDYFLYHVKINR